MTTGCQNIDIAAPEHFKITLAGVTSTELHHNILEKTWEIKEHRYSNIDVILGIGSTQVLF